MATLTSLLVRINGSTAGLDDALDAAPGRLERAGSKIKAASAAIGAGIGVALGAGLSQAIENESAGDKLAAQLGASGDRAAELGRVQSAVYAQAWGDSMDDVGTAIKGVVQNIGDLGEGASGGLEGLTTKALALAQTFDQDVGGTTAAVGQLLRTGLVKDANEAFDVLTAGFQSPANKADDLLETITEYGTQFRKVGLDAQTATGLMSQGLLAGARDADTVADAIKEFSIRAIDGSQTTADGFAAIGLSAQDMASKIAAGGPESAKALDLTLDRLRAIKDPTERSQAAVALFGTKAEDLGDALYALDPSSAVEALGQVGGAADRMAQTVSDNPAAALETFKRSTTQKLAEVAGAFATFAMNNQAVVQPLIIGLGVLAGAILAIRAGMAAWQAAQVAWSAATKIATAVQWLWNTAMSANPLALVLIAVVALVAGIVLLYQHSETARNIINAAFSGIQTAITAVWDWVKANWPLLLSILTGPIGAAVIQIVKHWDSIKAGGVAVWNWIRDLPGNIRSALSGVGQIIFAPFKAGFNAIASAWNNSVGRIGFTVPGWVPGLHGKSFHIPQVPLLDVGGTITSTGLAVVHQGETVTPAAAAPLPRGASGGAAGPAVLELRSSGQRIDDLLLEILRAAIKNEGGDAQTVLGRS